jgi:hypothetical protein
MGTLARMCAIIGLMGIAMPFQLRAAMIFGNSTHDLVTRFNPGLLEVGDEIILAGTERYLTSFSFEFWGANLDHPTTFAGAVEARVRFYQNNGSEFNGYATPGTTFFDSLWFPVSSPTDRSTFVFTEGADFDAGGLYIPVDTMTWSVQFRGMDGTDSVGVDIFSPPDVGADYPDYWQNDGGWSLLTNSVPMDFAAQMYANSVVPEPSSAVLSLLGGLGILGFARRLRRAE